MIPEYLARVIPMILKAEPGRMPDERLVSLAAVCAALGEYAASGGDFGEGAGDAFRAFFTSTPDQADPSGRLKSLTHRLFDSLDRCAASESDPVLRGRMIGAMYTLACGTGYAADRSRERRCHRAADAFIGQFRGASVEAVRAAVCICIGELLYPCPDPADECHVELRRMLSGWVSTLGREGRWPGLPAAGALERIGLLDRLGGLAADPACGEAAQRAFAFYRTQVAVPEEPGNFDPASLPLLGMLYDLTADGYATRDEAAAGRIARLLGEYARPLPIGSGDWYRCVARVLHRTVRESLDRLERAALARIA